MNVFPKTFKLPSRISVSGKCVYVCIILYVKWDTKLNLCRLGDSFNKSTVRGKGSGWVP